MSDKIIDVEKIIKDKNPSLLKWMPGFTLKYIKNILHQDEINIILEELKGVYGFDFCLELLDRFNIKLEVSGLENIPKEGGVVFAGNHPFGGLEALAHVKAIYPQRPDIKFVVNDILLNLKNLNQLFVGVNKHGTTASQALKNMDMLFGSGHAVFVYPAGMVSRKIDGEIQDLEWKKTFVTRAKKYNSTIVPVYTGGAKLSSFFYNIYSIRKTFGVKANVEMFYLVNEMMKQKNSTFKIVFGKPIKADSLDKSKKDKDWSEWVRAKVYDLGKTNKS